MTISQPRYLAPRVTEPTGPVAPGAMYGDQRPRALAFDVDADSLTALDRALPNWQIEVLVGATTDSVKHDWNPGGVDLLVVGDHGARAETLGLCRGLRSQAGQARTPLLVLVAPGDSAIVSAALAAGADSCLVLPIHAKELPSMIQRARAGNRPGRHTLGLDRAQRPDAWRDEGGEA